MQYKMGRTRRWVIFGALVLVIALVGTGIALKRAGSKDAAAGDLDGAGGSEEKVALASNSKAGKSAEQDKDGKAPVPVSISAVASGTISSYISSTANLVAEDEVKILAETEGRVDDLRVEEGHRIGRGQVLATIDRSDEEMSLKKAEFRAANAQIAYDRAKQVVADSLMSQEQFDKVRMENDIAAQELAEARWKLDKTAIKAPFGGRVTERAIRPGQHVRPGDHLFTVADFDPLIARIYLPEKDVYGLKEGRQVRISLKAHEEVRFVGRIRQISPVVDTATGTVKVTVEANDPPSEVRPGAFVTIDIVRETRTRATLVPREAVVRELQEAYVFVARDGAAVRRPVALGLEENGHIEAVSGIEPGEDVIVAGQGNLRDGARVKVIANPSVQEPKPKPDLPRRG